MKVLILSVTAGNGHNACAQAMKTRLETGYGATVEVVDLLKSFSTRTNTWIADKGYNLAAGKLQPFYNLFFNHYKKLKPCKRYSNSCQGTCVSTVGGLLKKIVEFQPDAIYCTHYDCAVALTDLRLVYDIPAHIVCANLDYVYSPFWESGIGVDHLVIPNEDFIPEGLEKGYRAEQLLPYGLPAKQSRVAPQSKTELRKELGLADKFTVLIMFGGGHWKGAHKFFRMVERTLRGRDDAQIIMINGRDESSFRTIERNKPYGVPVLNLGFTHEVPRYLSAADVVINKSGGTSITEILDAHAPMLIYEKTPAQERYNLVYLKEKGVALSFKNEKTLRTNLLKLLEDDDLRSRMERCTEQLARNGTDRTAELIASSPAADYTKLAAMQLDPKAVKRNVKRAMKHADKRSRKEGK